MFIDGYDYEYEVLSGEVTYGIKRLLSDTVFIFTLFLALLLSIILYHNEMERFADVLWKRFSENCHKTHEKIHKSSTEACNFP